MKRLICLIALLMAWTGSACAEPDYNALADAIYHAEGGSATRHPYGILKRYKTTTSRQACINTCKHAWKDYTRDGGIAPQIAPERGKKAYYGGVEYGYLQFLANRYCPTKGIGLTNDEKRLNIYWLSNVCYFLNKGANKWADRQKVNTSTAINVKQNSTVTHAKLKGGK